MKRKKILRNNLSLVIAITMILTSIFGNCLTTFAAEATDKTLSSTNNVSDEDSTTETEVEKDLVQYDNDWTIFQYLDPETDRPMFDIKYMDKTVEELEDEGLSLQYRFYYKNESIYYSYTSDWYNITNIVSEDEIAAIEKEKDKNYIQYQIVDHSGTSISKSYTLLIWPQEQPFPYILSSNIDYCEDYDLNTESNFVTVNLTYSEHLMVTDDLELDEYVNMFSDLTESYFADNLSFSNSTSTIEIGESTYSIQTSTVSFDLKLSKSCYDSGSSVSAYVKYSIEILGLKGSFSNQKPCVFMLTALTPVTIRINDSYIYPESITINSISNTVVPGNTLTLTATILPENTSNKTVTWVSSNETYATVDANGIVTAKDSGAGKTVTITVFSNSDSIIKSEYLITIVDSSPKVVPVTKINISSPTSSVAAGKKVTLTATVAPENATNKTVTWTSSNEKYATVNANGVVTTKAKGTGKTVTITAKANDGSNKQTSFKLKIKKIPVKKVKLSGKKTVKAGKKITLKATVTPSNATNKSVKWSTSNKKYATVSQKGVVKTKKAGKGKTVKITATAKDGSKKKATIKIKIK